MAGDFKGETSDLNLTDRILVAGPSVEVTPKEIAERMLERPVFVHLFTDGPTKELNTEQLRLYVQGLFGSNFTFTYDGDFAEYYVRLDATRRLDMAQKFAKAKRWVHVGDREKIALESATFERGSGVPLRDFLLSQRVCGHGYDGPRELPVDDNEYYDAGLLLGAYTQLLPDDLKAAFSGNKKLAIIITGRGIGDNTVKADGDGRIIGFGIHMRAGIASDNVAVISCTSLLQSPAGPDFIGGITREQMISDPRINELIRGITLQMIMHGSEGPAICSRSDLDNEIPDLTVSCRLHDSHKIRELELTQLKGAGKPEFCARHAEIFRILQAFEKRGS